MIKAKEARLFRSIASVKTDIKMGKPKVLLVTIPNMITQSDLTPITAVADLEYLELERISSEDLAIKCHGFDVLMLNYDVIKKLDATFYAHENVQILKTISTDITGMDWAKPDLAEQNNVTLQNIPHYSTESVAETIVCEILLHSRQRLSAFKDVINGRDIEAREGINLLDRKAGIVGFGSIGSRVNELLSCFGMNVSIWNRTPKGTTSLQSLEGIFEESEVICLSMAAIIDGKDANKHIIGRDLLMRCKGAIIINLARDILVDSDAMVEAIKAGCVAGYTVETSPSAIETFSKIDCVHIAPKNAWKSKESLKLLADTWVLNTISAINDQPDNVYKD